MKHKILVFLLFIACTSASAQLTKGALISTFGDRNLSDNPLDTKVYEKLMKDTAFNLTPIVYHNSHSNYNKTLSEEGYKT